MTYKLVECAESFFIVDERDEKCLTENKYPSAYINGTVTRKETNAEGWSRHVAEPVIGAREFAEAIVAALNSRATADLTADDSGNLQVAAE